MKFIGIFGILIGIAGLSGCSQEPGSAPPAAFDVQEGIGGDLAALYVKGITLTSLDPSNWPNFSEEHQAYIARINSVALYSTDSPHPSLFHWEGGDLIVNRPALLGASGRRVVREFTKTVGVPFDPPEFVFRHPFLKASPDLETARQLALRWVTMAFEATLSGGDHAVHDLIADLALADRLALLLKQMNVEFTNSTLLEQGSHRAVDAITQVDRGGRAMTWISRPRLAGAGWLYQLLPLLLVHEGAQGDPRSSFEGDYGYRITQRLFALDGVWMGL